MKKALLLASILSLTLAAPAFAADTDASSSSSMSTDDNGGYKADAKSSSTDAAGTTTTNEKKVKKSVSDNGDYKKTTKVTHKRNPKGLMNPSTKSSTEDTVEKSGNKVTTEHVEKQNGDTVEDTKTESNTSGQ